MKWNFLLIRLDNPIKTLKFQTNKKCNELNIFCSCFISICMRVLLVLITEREREKERKGGISAWGTKCGDDFFPPFLLSFSLSVHSYHCLAFLHSEWVRRRTMSGGGRRIGKFVSFFVFVLAAFKAADSQKTHPNHHQRLNLPHFNLQQLPQQHHGKWRPFNSRFNHHQDNFYPSSPQVKMINSFFSPSLQLIDIDASPKDILEWIGKSFRACGIHRPILRRCGSTLFLQF